MKLVYATCGLLDGSIAVHSGCPLVSSAGLEAILGSPGNQ